MYSNPFNTDWGSAAQEARFRLHYIRDIIACNQHLSVPCGQLRRICRRISMIGVLEQNWWHICGREGEEMAWIIDHFLAEEHGNTHVPNWQKMLVPPMLDVHSVLASHKYFCMHLSSVFLYVLTYPLIIEIPATAASLTESFLPIERAEMERWENDVFKASNKLTTMLMNCFKKIKRIMH